LAECKQLLKSIRSIFVEAKAKKSMKKIIFFICVIAIAITLNSCKHRMYYACCDTGHPHWEGRKYKSGDDLGIRLDEQAHDNSIHGGVGTAGRCHD